MAPLSAPRYIQMASEACYSADRYSRVKIVRDYFMVQFLVQHASSTELGHTTRQKDPYGTEE